MLGIHLRAVVASALALLGLLALAGSAAASGLTVSVPSWCTSPCTDNPVGPVETAVSLVQAVLDILR